MNDVIAPSYVQIKNFILNKIHSNEWKPGFKIPSENDLAKMFNVSRMTVNRAVRELTSENILKRVQGKGTYVAYESNVAEMLEIRGVIDEIEKMGKKHSLEVIDVEVTIAEGEIVKLMGLNSGDKVYKSVFLHFADNEPFQIEIRYVNPKIVPDYLNVDFTKETAHQYLMRTTALTEAEHIVEAIMPDRMICELLKISKNTPCLQLSRRTWLGNDVVTYVKFIAPGDKYKIGTRFRYAKDGSTKRESIY
ncbi:histidine utilization repressor [Deferribacter thermophilus]|uniref:histidine utilization repressor n=1 Tax=Deferribacter thermophilus TaxID=53573 RepID=UPI003C1A6B67